MNEFQENETVIYTLVRKVRGIMYEPRAAVIKRIYPSGFAVVEFKDGSQKQVRLNTLKKATT